MPCRSLQVDPKAEKRVISMSVLGIDFFCGIGGATKGFQNAGIRILKGIDNDPTCQDTYEKNCHPSKFLLADLNSLKPRDLMQEIRRSASDRLFFIACAPCQPFSRSFKKVTKDDIRTDMILRFSDFVKELMPDVIFVENVPGFMKAGKGRILTKFLSVLTSANLNYCVEWKIVDAKTYGVPQTRSRFMMLASRLGKISFPPATHGKNLASYLTVREAITKYPEINAGGSHATVPNQSARKLSSLNMRRMQKTPRDGGSRKDWPKNLWLKCHNKDGSGHSDVYGRMSWGKPSPTLTCKCNSISNGRFGHPSQNRAISLREAAALQTFPDDFIFYDTPTSIARHIGNAVPPLIAQILGNAIRNHLSTHLHKS